MAASRCSACSRRHADEQGVVVAEAAPQRLAQLGELVAQPALGHLGEHLGVAFAGDEGGEHQPARDARTSEATESSLMPASSRVFWMRWNSEVWAWMSRLR